MVTFNKYKDESICTATESFTVTIFGDESEYIETIKSILFIMSTFDKDAIFPQSDLNYLCNLVSCMLPDSEQIINKVDINLLKQIKKKSI